MPGFDEDLKKMKELINEANKPLSDILNEVILYVNKIIKIVNVNTSGNIRVFNKEPSLFGNNFYQLTYQFGNLGNLVHELTHISVNEKYGRYFVNYESSQKKSFDPKFTKCQIDGNDFYFVKEPEKFESNWMDDKMNETLLEKLNNLRGLVNSIPEKTRFESQLDYGRVHVHKEYDTVINQILIWSYESDYSKSKNNTIKTFFEAIKEAAHNAYVDRMNAAKPAYLKIEETKDPSKSRSVLDAHERASTDAAIKAAYNC